MDQVAEEPKPKPKPKVKHQLTNQQYRVIDLIAFGNRETVHEMMPDDVAREMSLSINTVRYHIDQIKLRYGTDSLTIAALKYIKECYD